MNRLAAETSPYLRQHRDNPVDWYPWGNEALAAAVERNVPILLSVGYSACHWCHVMAHECFEDAEVAALMNRLYVCIKVDREERPDVDSIYMEAVQALTGRGGWPLTAFLTPTGQPFYGGTYFPKPNFVNLLTALDDVWRNKPQDIQQNVGVLMQALNTSAAAVPTSTVPGIETVGAALRQFARAFDSEWGGFGSAPKFPSTMNLDLVLRAYSHQPSEGAKTIITTSLDAMASGGIYDHLGGGFARYSVDRQWLAPHFEKMLYDQALLVKVYLHAWLVFGEPRWKQVVEETIGYVLGELSDPSGGWYSAEDADSVDDQGHSHEGLFYTWSVAEIRQVLGVDRSAAACGWWQVTEEGNFEGRNILCRLDHRGDLLRPPEIDDARRDLYAARATRPRPGLDNKVLTEWNGLFLSALAEAAVALNRPDWLAAAVTNGEFLTRELRSKNGRWSRSWQAEGMPKARLDGLAMDHACLIDAFTRLAEATGQARWIGEASSVADTLLDHFWDTDAGGLFTTAEDAQTLIVRQKDLLDNATPSANSTAAIALYRLAALTGEVRYRNLADQIMQLLGTIIDKAPSAAGNALAAVDLQAIGIAEIVVTGHRPDLVAELHRRWLPNAVVAWGEPYESPLWVARPGGFAYICHNYACQLPIDDVTALAEMLDAG